MRRAILFLVVLACSCAIVERMVPRSGFVENVAYGQTGSFLAQLKSGQLVGWSTATDGSVAGDLFMGRSGTKQLSIAAASALTNPVLQVDQATGSAITGIKVTSAASGSGILFTALGGANENLGLNSKGSSSYVSINGVLAVDQGAASYTRSYNGGQFVWSSTSGPTGSADTGLKRVAAGVIGPTQGDTVAAGWIQNTAGRTRMTTSPTNATAVMANLTDLGITVISARKYSGTLVVWAKNSTVGEGLQFDFNGGGSTWTSFQCGFAAIPPGPPTLGVFNATAISTALTATTATAADACYTIHFAGVCANGGTLIPRFAEVSHTSGTATVELNSYLWIEDSSN